MLAPLFLTLFSVCHAVQHWGSFVEISHGGIDEATCQYWNEKNIPHSEKYYVKLKFKSTVSETLSIERRECSDGYWSNTEGPFDFKTLSSPDALSLSLTNNTRQSSILDPIDNKDVFGMAQDCWGRFVNSSMPDDFNFDGKAYCSAKNAIGELNLAVQITGASLEVSTEKYVNGFGDPEVHWYTDETVIVSTDAKLVCQLQNGNQKREAVVIVGENSDDKCHSASS